MRRRKLRAKKLMKHVNITAVSSRQFSFILYLVYFYITKICKKKKAKMYAKNDTELIAPVLFIDESQIPLLMTKN